MAADNSWIWCAVCRTYVHVADLTNLRSVSYFPGETIELGEHSCNSTISRKLVSDTEPAPPPSSKRECCGGAT